jgi:hypothetical protein
MSGALLEHGGYSAAEMGFYHRADSPVPGALYGPQRHKGSRKRMARIRPGDHWSPEILIFFVAVILFLVVVIPLLIRNGGN